MITRRDFSRSDRMAELYEQFFYDAVSPHPHVSLRSTPVSTNRTAQRPPSNKQHPEGPVEEGSKRPCTQAYSKRLAAVRTDLDSYTEVEGCSLAFSDYARAGKKIPSAWQRTFRSDRKFVGSLKKRKHPPWLLDAIRPFAEASAPDIDYLRQLTVGLPSETTMDSDH